MEIRIFRFLVSLPQCWQVAMATAKRSNSKAQGRAAHPGNVSHMIPPPKGCKACYARDRQHRRFSAMGN